ncbi:MAG: hypothetical protein ACR2FF_10120 [Mycobacteriales bacterium]
MRQALLVTGVVGVGKTSVGAAIADRLDDAGIPGAFVDLDAIRRCWPAPRRTGSREH